MDRNGLNFCTIIGKDYIIKGLALYDSLERYAGDFTLWICCMDEIAFTVINKLNLENVILIPLKLVEDEKLLSVKKSRTLSEYCWTLKSSWVLFVMNNYPEVDSIVFLDSDLFFFSDPRPVFEELEQGSILICSQHDREEVERQFGKFQAGFLGFKKDHVSMSVLNWWKDRCIEWCSSEQGHHDKWGDQKYLDQWPSLTTAVTVTKNWGIDAALWSAANNTELTDSGVLIKNHKLICYHFCTLTIFNENEYDLWRWPNWRVGKALLDNIYLPYITALKKVMKDLEAIGVPSYTLTSFEYDKKYSSNYLFI